eukprot:CAMPEP_0119265702 /NCGR_PEP_ID=MMETSP1329-20130426/4434_1 /TAXON_ID=114041 /ORGANISM="Genus nov. species nov., Strain RCC1024" /LENGTH=94 /DNA_ID=CAMNT_0007265549 /DNA_START=222 /DNA_END=503 /DNA_ORIENTATION=-
MSRGESAMARRTIKSILNANPKDYYEILGVEPGDEEKSIRREYRSLATAVHPDKCTEEGASEALARINEAKTCLLDEAARKRYDRDVYKPMHAP